jgi:hypothetical protein
MATRARGTVPVAAAAAVQARIASCLSSPGPVPRDHVAGSVTRLLDPGCLPPPSSSLYVGRAGAHADLGQPRLVTVDWLLEGRCVAAPDVVPRGTRQYSKVACVCTIVRPKDFPRIDPESCVQVYVFTVQAHDNYNYSFFFRTTSSVTISVLYDFCPGFS